LQDNRCIGAPLPEVIFSRRQLGEAWKKARRVGSLNLFESARTKQGAFGESPHVVGYRPYGKSVPKQICVVETRRVSGPIA